VVHISRVNCTEMAGDRSSQPANRITGTAKAVARLVSFAQITCSKLIALHFKEILL